MEKKPIKISLVTFIIGIILIACIIAIAYMYIQISDKDKALEESKIALENKEKELQNEKEKKSNDTDKKSDTSSTEVELDINDKIVKELINKKQIYDKNFNSYEDIRIPIVYKNKKLDDQAMFIFAIVEEYYNNRYEGSWNYEDDVIVLSKDTISNKIANRFGPSAKYKDQAYGKTNLQAFDWFFGGIGETTYENGNYYIHDVPLGDGTGDVTLLEKVYKAYQYDKKIEIYVKAGYDHIDAKGLGESDFVNLDENEIKAAGVTNSIYKDYDFSSNTPKNKLIEKPWLEEKIDDVMDELDTYIYTFEQDSNGEYYWTGFRKAN